MGSVPIVETVGVPSVAGGEDPRRRLVDRVHLCPRRTEPRRRRQLHTWVPVRRLRGAPERPAGETSVCGLMCQHRYASVRLECLGWRIARRPSGRTDADPCLRSAGELGFVPRLITGSPGLGYPDPAMPRARTYIPTGTRSSTTPGACRSRAGASSVRTARRRVLPRHRRLRTGGDPPRSCPLIPIDVTAHNLPSTDRTRRSVRL